MPTELSDFFMQCAHRSINQKRRDNVRDYEVHPRGVRRRVSQVTLDPRIGAIADLHDVEEDVAHDKNRIPIPADQQEIFGLPARVQPYFYNLESIGLVFGEFVRDGVEELSDEYTKEKYPHLNRKARKQLQREKYSLLKTHNKWVKLSDIGENLADDGKILFEDGGADVGFNKMFIYEKSLCLPYLKADDRENKLLFSQAMDILHEQARKFKVRLK